MARASTRKALWLPELSGPELVRGHRNAFNQENGRIWSEASFNRSLEAVLWRMEPGAQGSGEERESQKDPDGQ